jgi:hypothetical protein
VLLFVELTFLAYIIAEMEILTGPGLRILPIFPPEGRKLAKAKPMM